MPHNNAYLKDMEFGDGGTTVKVPFHDAEALHDEDGAVKSSNIADSAVTEGKLADGAVTVDSIADGAVTMEKLGEDVTEAWDSQSQFEHITLTSDRYSIPGSGYATVEIPIDSSMDVLAISGFTTGKTEVCIVSIEATGGKVSATLRNTISTAHNAYFRVSLLVASAS